MIRMEYPKANIEGLTDREKIIALKRQLDTLTNNVQLVLESIDGDLEGINEYIGGVPDDLDNSVSTISKRVDEVETAVGTLEDRDYIVEQGTSGIWTYRKWNSGKFELWKKSDTATPSSWSALYSVASLYYANFSTTVPFTVYDGIADVNVEIVGSNIGWVCNNRMSNNTTVSFSIVRYQNSGGITYSVFIRGRWK